ncbi:FadD3 family acyl-CoA ligase [Phenylobacterium sp.]|uniref:FadD3 family acyl-CoA ligase n=1 Tax=Phenylobacterium sp. TaxID=1871053 RepID=UPI002F3F7C2C
MTRDDPQPATIPAMVAASAVRFGDRPAMVGEDGEVLTYPQLVQAMRAAARGFMALGVEPGDRAAIWAPNSLAWIVAALGLQAVGGVLVPVSTRLKGAEAGDILRRSGASVLLTVKDFLGLDYLGMIAGEDLPELRHRLLLTGRGNGAFAGDVLRHGEAVPEAALQTRLDALTGDHLLDLIFTSGTTGRPKGVMTTHAQNLATYAIYSRGLTLTPQDRYLIVNPFFHTLGYKAGWLSALMRGALILPHAVFDADAVLARIEGERASVMPGPPTLYHALLASPRLPSTDLSSLRVAITGAAMVPVELIERMRRDLSIDVVMTAYGLSETCGVVSMCRPDDDDETISLSSGAPIEGVEVKIADADGAELPRGETGEIMVRGFNVMKGYFEDPEATRAVLGPDGWLATGDIGAIDPHGNVRITDRKKDMFIVGGFNVYPAEVENALQFHPAIAQAAVVGVPDARMGEVGKAFVVLRRGAALAEAELVAWCRERMANYKVPRAVEFRSALPTNAAGKVEKFVLRREG